MGYGVVFVLTVFLAWFACGKVRVRLLAAFVLDNPNERSLHKAPVPRGGGVGIWLAVFPLWVAGDIILGQLEEHFFLMLGTAALIVISWLDDKKSLSPQQRFMVHLAAVACGIIALPINLMVFQGVFPLLLDRALAGFAWLWFINLTNFMDGIDGITAAETSHLAIGFLLLGAFIPALPASSTIIAVLLLGGVIGFLVWNWHPAKLFMGDVGSIPLGFLLGYLMLLLAVHGYLGVAVCLPLYYVADASITLIRRIYEKKKFWQAHREHFYQQAALVAGHVRTLKPIIGANLGLLAICFATIKISPFVLLLAPLLVISLLWYLKRLSQPKG